MNPDIGVVEPQKVAGKYLCCKSESDAEAKPIDRIGQDAHADVRDDEDDQQTTEKKKFEGRESKAKCVIGQNKENTCKRFDSRIHGRDSQVAIAAFAPQQQPTQDGDVVVGPDGHPATRAMRGGGNDRNSFRNARDADIQEAADDQAKKEKEERNHRIDCATGREVAQ